MTELVNRFGSFPLPMRNIARKSHWIVVTLFLGAQLLLPLVSIVLYQRRYDFAPRAVGYHLLLVGTGYLVLLGGSALLCSLHAVRRRSISKYLLPLAWGLFTVVLYFAYLLAWGGRIGMGMNMTPFLVYPYVQHPSLVASTFSIPLSVFWGILVGLPMAILLAYGAAASSFSAVMLRLRAWSRKPLSRLQQGGLLAGILALVGLFCAVVNQWPPPRSAVNWFDDPILPSLLLVNNVLPVADLGLTNDPIRVNYTAPAQFQKKNVILIVLDACRSDHLSVMGYERKTTPFLESLDRSGHLHKVQTCYSASCCTFGGVMTLLRSKHWFKMAVHGFSLQDVLKKAGYKVHFVLGGDLSSFFNLKLYYGNSLDSFSDGLSPQRHFPMNDDRGVFESMGKIAPYDGTPSFIYLHLMSAHGLSPRWPINVVYQPAAFVPEPTLYNNNYDNGVFQADRNIRYLFMQLKQKGYLENSVVFITGDHGDSVGERGKFGHGQNLYDEEVTPPLLIYDPDPVQYKNVELARQIDVAPTIVDRLGLPIPSSWDGRSLLHSEPERFSYLRIADLYAVVDYKPERTLKYIYNDRTKQEELYDVKQDPGEERNIFARTDAKEIRELRTAIGSFDIHPGAL